MIIEGVLSIQAEKTQEYSSISSRLSYRQNRNKNMKWNQRKAQRRFQGEQGREYKDAAV